MSLEEPVAHEAGDGDRIAALEDEVATLETELDRERRRRQAVVDRYEGLLTDDGSRDEPPGLVARLRAHFGR